MFFFTRKGYLQEIKRLQIANNDLQETLLKQQDNQQKLLDRLMTLLDPATHREYKRGQPEIDPSGQLVPQFLNERYKPTKRAYREPKSKVKPPLQVDFNQSSERDRTAVAKVISASIEDGN